MSSRRSSFRLHRRAARRGGIALIALLAAPAAAVDAPEVLRYDLFSGRRVGSAGEMDLAVAGDGHVLLGWTVYRPAEKREEARVRWLSPDGLPASEPIQVDHRGYLRTLAARPGHHALVVSSALPPERGSWLNFLTPAGVAGRVHADEIGCDYPEVVTATGDGYFLTCLDFQTGMTEAVWLDDEPLGVRGRELLGYIDGIAAAGGPRTTVAVVFRDGDGSLFARWMSIWRREAAVPLDAAGSNASVAQLRDGVFGVAWVHEYARSSDPDEERALTGVHAATFREPGVVRHARRFSPVSGTADEATGEQRRPRLFPTAPKKQVLGWFGCSYQGSPGGLFCPEDDGLFLRDRIAARPSGAILELPQVPAGARVGFTGELLIATRLERRPDDLWDLEVLGFRLE